MSDRRSSRARKQVDYAKFIDDDDDFAESTPPLSKKPKIFNKENQEKKKEKSVQENKSQKLEKRPSLEEKLYERQLKDALDKSLRDSQGSNSDKDMQPELKPAQVEKNIEEKQPPSDDEIIVLGTVHVVEDTSTNQRKSASKPCLGNDGSDANDSDFNADVGVSDEDDDNDSYKDDSDSDYEEFRDSKSKAKPKNQSTPVKSKASVRKPASVGGKSKSTTTACTVKPSVTSKNGNSKPVSSAQLTSPCRSVGLAARKPSWTPPAPVGTSKSPAVGGGIQSPSGGLRLGLSRNQRVKPLHPTLKVQH